MSCRDDQPYEGDGPMECPLCNRPMVYKQVWTSSLVSTWGWVCYAHPGFALLQQTAA